MENDKLAEKIRTLDITQFMFERDVEYLMTDEEYKYIIEALKNPTIDNYPSENLIWKLNNYIYAIAKENPLFLVDSFNANIHSPEDLQEKYEGVVDFDFELANEITVFTAYGKYFSIQCLCGQGTFYSITDITDDMKTISLFNENLEFPPYSYEAAYQKLKEQYSKQ